jgi:hypothetical protein
VVNLRRKAACAGSVGSALRMCWCVGHDWHELGGGERSGAWS